MNFPPLRWIRRSALLLLALASVGCTGPSGRHWGFDATTLKRVGRAAFDAAVSPEVLVPAVGAAAFQIGDWDEKVSDWAVDNTPIFGQVSHAQDWSDGLRDAARVTSGIAIVVTPTSKDFSYEWRAKALDLGAGAAAIFGTEAVTGLLKSATGRERPDSRDGGFPSAHASATAVATTLARRYVDFYPIPDWSKWTLHGALIAWPYSVGWARVEGKRHFPADVLAGIALGTFIGNFANEILEVDPSEIPQLSVEPTAGGMTIGFRLRW